MKKSILVLSALLTLVVSGICLQSCSSEYEEYTTEEYGYYTEEEIAAMKAIAEKYDTTIEVDENYCGRKASLEEFERTVIQFADLPGEYQLVESEDREGCYLMKKTSNMNRVKTRAMELGDIGNITVGTVYPKENVPSCTFYLSWRLATSKREGVVTLSVSQPYRIGGNYQNRVNATITPYYITIFENVSISSYGTSYGRYCISGTYYAGEGARFIITKVAEEM